MKANKNVTLTIAILGPFAVASAYAVVAQFIPESFMKTSFYIAIGMAIGLGVIGLLLSINVRLWSIAALIVYMPIAYVLLNTYLIAVACFVFSSCI
jgi:hypothetical protein